MRTNNASLVALCVLVLGSGWMLFCRPITVLTLSAQEPDKKLHPLAAGLAGTKWVNSAGATFEWDKQGRFFHRGKEKEYLVVDALRLSIVFGPKHVDTLVFDAKLTTFRQSSTAGSDLTGRQLPASLPLQNTPLPIDLLKTANPGKDSSKGKWKIEGKALVSTPAAQSILEIPCTVPEEYRLRLQVERKTGSDALCLGLVVGDRRCLVVLDAGPKIEYVSGLEMIDGKHCAANETTRRGRVFNDGRSSEVLCTVRQEGIVVAVDGKTVIEYKGSWDRLSLGDFWKTPNDRALFVGSQNSTVYRISEMELTALSWQGNKNVTQKKDISDPAKAPAQNHLDIHNAKVIDDFLRLTPESHITTKESFTGPIEVVVVAKTNKNDIRLHAFNGACVIFNWVVKRHELRVNRPDGNDSKESGSLATAQVQPLDANKWHTLRWRITSEGMSVAVDGKVVFTESRPYTLSANRPVILASADSVVDVKSLDVIRLPSLQPLSYLPQQTDTPGQLAISPDGTFLANACLGEDHRIYVAALPSGKRLYLLDGHSEKIMGLAFSPNSQSLYSGSQDGTVREWNLKTGQAKRTIVEAMVVSGVGIVPDFSKYPTVIVAKVVPGKPADLDGRLKVGDRLVAISGRDGKMVQAVDVPWKQFYSLLGGEVGMTVKLEVMPSGEEKSRIYEIKRNPVAILNRVLAMTVSTDGKKLAVGCTHRLEDGKTVPHIRILDVENGKEQVAFQTGTEQLWGLAFSPDGKLLASAGHKVAKVWEVATGKEVADLKGHKMVVCSAAFSSDGKMLVTAGTDKSVKTWKVPTWEEMPAPSEQSTVETVAFAPIALSPDGRLLAVGGLGGVDLWDFTSRKKGVTIRVPAIEGKDRQVPSLAFSPDSSLLAFGSSADRCIHLWGSDRPRTIAAGVVDEIIAEKTAKERAAFSKMAEQYGFDKLDYTKGPQGEPLITREATESTHMAAIPGGGKVKMPVTIQGYLNDKKEFIKHGLCTYWFERPNSDKRGVKHAEIDFFNDKAHGVDRGWHRNGRLWYQVATVKGEVQGVHRGWHNDGSLWFEKEVKDGLGNGKYVVWHRNGKKELEGQFKNGWRQGTWKSWYENGNKHDECFYKDDLLQGISRTYYQDGSKLDEVSFRDGLLDGPYLKYYPSISGGRVWIRANYLTGQKHGAYTEYSSDGTIHHSSRWEFGRLAR